MTNKDLQRKVIKSYLGAILVYIENIQVIEWNAKQWRLLLPTNLMNEIFKDEDNFNYFIESIFKRLGSYIIQVESPFVNDCLIGEYLCNNYQSCMSILKVVRTYDDWHLVVSILDEDPLAGENN